MLTYWDVSAPRALEVLASLDQLVYQPVHISQYATERRRLESRRDLVEVAVCKPLLMSWDPPVKQMRPGRLQLLQSRVHVELTMNPQVGQFSRSY